MDITNEVYQVIEEVTGSTELSPEQNLKSDIGLDSLSIVTVIVGLEEKFGIMFDDSDLNPDELNTVKDLINLTEKYI